MTYDYQVLPPSLHETADAAIEWFIDKWGVQRSHVNVEAEINPDIQFRPTFVANLNDGHLLCVEVLPTVYSPPLDSVVLACLHRGLPVKLFTAVPKNVSDPDYSRNIKLAKMTGVGVLEVNKHSGDLVLSALSLSLMGLRPFRPGDFPAKYRHALQHADQTFRDGEPSKACSLVYDELESCFRLVVKKCVSKQLWQNQRNLNLDSGSWAKIIDAFDKTLARRNALTRKLTHPLLARISGVTTYRNQSGHKVAKLSERMKRDQALRTRFEAAIDLLHEFLEAVRGFHI